MSIKKVFALLLALCMVFCLVPSAVFADGLEVPGDKEDFLLSEGYHEITEEDRIELASGLYRTETPVFDAVSPQASAFDTPEEALAYLREQLALRVSPVTVRCNVGTGATSSLLNEIAAYLFYGALDHSGVGNQGDYLLWHISGYSSPSCSYSGGVATYTFSFSFHTTAEQEAAVAEEIDRVLESLSLSGKSDYQKFFAIYEYITHNIEYDFDSEGMLKHTAYAALINKKAVCQGYASLLYRMLLTVGIDCRVVAGDGSSRSVEVNHGWNIVRLGNYYYNTDSTWDAAGVDYYINGEFDHKEYPYTYMLRCNDNFPQHLRAEAYSSDEFNEAYPMSPRDFDPETDDVEYEVSVTEDNGAVTLYETFAEGFNAAPNNSVITLLKDVSGWALKTIPTEIS